MEFNLKPKNATFVRGRDLASGVRDNISRANRYWEKCSEFNLEKILATFSMPLARPYDKVAASDAGDVRLTVPGDATGAMTGYAVFDLQYGMDFEKKELVLEY